ncbi:MAG: hypothetical protein KJ604_20675 [Gammaproteobacteria bacterium]|nr:hypothetical protein [Gammaproteobacteria bacterium]
MNPHDRLKLSSALTAYDIRQSKRKGYNRYAIGHYLKALEQTERAIDQGEDIRSALVANYCGRLLDVTLKAVGLPLSTRDEQRG